LPRGGRFDNPKPARLPDGTLDEYATWPGMDWDVLMQPDPDVGYLASWATRVAKEQEKGDIARNEEFDFAMEMEISHFAVPPAYRPQTGDWLQAIGRWVIDCGHPDYPANPSNPNSLYSKNADYRQAVDRLGRQRGDLHDLPEAKTELHPPELLVSSSQTDA